MDASMALATILEFLFTIIGDWYILVLTGILILFFIPAIVLILFYAVAVFLYAYKSRRKDTYNKETGYWTERFWNSARLSVCTFISLLAKYWHAHDVVGFENIPSKGPALLCIYHGTLPIDLYYILAKLQLEKRRRLKVIVDHFLFKLPGLNCLLNVFGCFTGPASECVRTLRPIIPVFTQNCRESFKVVRTGQWLTRWIYEKTKLPLVLYYGGFPVKMRTFIGPQIDYDLNMTPEEVSKVVQSKISELIKEHQSLPGSVISGLKDRWMPKPIKLKPE